MKITFKDVGQGDSILLEWDDKIAIIDCSRNGRLNPVLKYIENESNYKIIEFMILSHPHIDHYSGFYDLLLYCESNNIKIKKFYHTLETIGTEYWKFFEIDTEAKRRLEKLIEKLWELHNKKFLEILPIAADTVIELFKDAYIRCLAPSTDDKLLLQKILKYDPKTNQQLMSKAVNHIATILKIKIKDDIILLTSDAEKEAFIGILHRRSECVQGKNLILCQIPHHGSIHNYEKTFWDFINNKISRPAIVSSGEHGTYMHPHFETLMAFHEHGYSIRSTTILYGMEKYIQEMRNYNVLLEDVSSLDEEYIFAGDITYEWKNLIE